jgi:rhodanese-related sulfurtransferase
MAHYGQTMSRWKIAREAGLILAAAALLGAAVNAFRPESHKLAWVREHPEAALPPEIERDTPSPPSDTGALFTEITPDVAFRMHGAGALFLDARRTAAYEAGHIAGARSIPVWEHDADARIDTLRGDGTSFDKDIVVYCSGATCEDSARLAEKLALAGFFKLSLYKDGFPDWEMRGWPVSHGIGP